ncbi:hypothetical protein GW777_07070 [Candidatus Peregrinibacteria bacterium]|nr:hypothetical protein [Candidatus Peregrinibacteria bacterium]
MLHLYDRAQLCGGIVLDTDDQSELLMGFWTKHGDVGDISQLTEPKNLILLKHLGGFL